MKYFLLTILSLNLFSQSVEDLYEDRLNQESAKKAAQIFFEQASVDTNLDTQCQNYNKAAYLTFFRAATELINLPKNTTDEEKKKALEKEKELLKKTMDMTKLCDKSSKPEYYAESLYHFGTALARFSQIEGDFTAFKNWPQIKKSMKTIISLKQSETFYYGAFRTLGIANTEMPPGIGSRSNALRYLETAVNKTLWPARKISLYVFNSISLAKLYFKTDKKKEACEILAEINSLDEEQIFKENFNLAPETILDQKRSIEDFNKFNCNSYL